MLEPPEDWVDGLTGSIHISVVQWWNALSAEQRQTVEQILDAPNCTLQFHERVHPESESAIELFSDDWDTHWADNWKSDFREYLTEHPELNLDFFSLLVLKPASFPARKSLHFRAGVSFAAGREANRVGVEALDRVLGLRILADGRGSQT